MCNPALDFLAIALTKPEDANDHRYGLKVFLLLCARWSWLGSGLGLLGLAADAAFGCGPPSGGSRCDAWCGHGCAGTRRGQPLDPDMAPESMGLPEDRFARKALHDLLLAHTHLLNRDMRTQASAHPDWAFMPKGDNHPNPQSPWP